MNEESPRPLLLRFLSRLQPPTAAVIYDRAAQINVLVGETIPAVRAGVDVKTMTVVPGED